MNRVPHQAQQQTCFLFISPTMQFLIVTADFTDGSKTPGEGEVNSLLFSHIIGARQYIWRSFMKLEASNGIHRAPVSPINFLFLQLWYNPKSNSNLDNYLSHLRRLWPCGEARFIVIWEESTADQALLCRGSWQLHSPHSRGQLPGLQPF